MAHVGVLKALNENRIFPETLSGVSAGALVAVLYADGYSPDEILQLLSHLEPMRMLRFGGFRLGLFEPRGLQKLLKQVLRSEKFEQLKLPVTVGTTNIDLGEITYFNSGEIIPALMASMAFPFLIKPQLIHGMHYVDGGLMNNLPVQPLVGNCHRIIGVHVNSPQQKGKLKSTGNYLDHVIHLGLRANILPLIGFCDMFIEPPDLNQYHLLRISSATEVYKKGYDFTLQFLQSYPGLESFQKP